MQAKTARIALDIISIPNPCPASWEKMRGDDRARFCTECNLHVYNLSAMTRDAAEALLVERGETQGRMCVRVFKRADGTVITRDCGGGLRAAAKRAARRAGAAAGAVLCAALAPVFLASSGASKDVTRASSRAASIASSRTISFLRSLIAPLLPSPPLTGIVAPPPTVLAGQVAIMGDIAMPPSTQPTTQPTTQPATQPSTVTARPFRFPVESPLRDSE